MNVLDQAFGQDWALYNNDCVPAVAALPENSVDFSLYSPPFPGLFFYSESEADMGNCKNGGEFMEHYSPLVEALYQATRPGRLSAVHCSDLPNHKGTSGEVSLRDFPGDIIRLHQQHGWVYHSRVTIWKDPVVEMQRTKTHGLLHKTFKADTTSCRVGMPDYLLLFRKYEFTDDSVKVTQKREPGDYVGTNAPGNHGTYSIEVWQRYASPVWFDINQTRVLNNYRDAKGKNDEKHIAPLQLDVCERAIDLWSNRGEVVLDPFMGIGSTGVSALNMGRKTIGTELKPEYFQQAVKNLTEAEILNNQPTLFDMEAV